MVNFEIYIYDWCHVKNEGSFREKFLSCPVAKNLLDNGRQSSLLYNCSYDLLIIFWSSHDAIIFPLVTASTMRVSGLDRGGDGGILIA